MALTALLAGLIAGPAEAADPPYFTNVTAEVGLDGVPAFRVSVGDLDGDGYPDLFVHREPDHGTGDVLDKQFLYLNEEDDDPANPTGRIFVDHTAGSGIRANRDGTGDGRHSDAAMFADVDNDGDLDVFTNVYLHRNYDLQEGTNDLLLNNGDATFSLSPSSTFHDEPNWNTPAAVFVDYDNDGNVDLYTGHWYNPDSTLTVDHLYKGDGEGGFTNVTDGSGIDQATTCVYAVAVFDWNDDGFTDLFAPPYSRSVLGSVPRHFRNNGDGTFTQVQDQTGYDQYRGLLGAVSFGTVHADFDNDGDQDFLEILTHGEGDGEGSVHTTAVANVDEVFSWDFYRVYDRGTEDPDLTHHGDHYGSWFDFDGDMLLDFTLTESGYDNPRLYLFKQNPDHTFQPVTVESGLNDVNELGLSPGYATPFDYDRDGDEDLILTTSGELRVYRNDVGNQASWLAIDLEGVGVPGYSNRSAIGAKVEVTAGGVTQTKEVHRANGHEGPQRPFTLYFGLGDATVVDSIRIRWPNDSLTVQELFDEPVNQFLEIREPCDYAADPSNLLLEKDGEDVLMTWDDPGEADWTWNVYRDTSPNPAGWGGPHEENVTDEDGSTPGIQHWDVGALGDTENYFYLVTAVNECGETDLR
jgi:hypothetical protein